MNKIKRFDFFIISGFSFLIIITIAISLLGITSLGKTKSLFQQTYENSFHAWVETEQANADLIAAHRAMKDIALSRNDPQFQTALNAFNSYDVTITEYFSKMIKTDPGNALLSDVITAYDDWAPIRAKTIEFASSGQYDLAAENTRTAGSAQVQLISDKLQLLVGQKEAEADDAYAQTENTSLLSTRLLIWMTVLAAVLALLMSLYVRNRLLRFQSLLHDEKEKLRVTLESIGDGVITTDTNSNVVSLNRIAEEFTGWTVQDAIGKPFSEVFDITNAYTGARAKDPVLEVLTTDSICHLENHTILTSKDGTKSHIADSAAPIKDDSGQTSGVVMIFRDVTERKIAENELKLSEARLKTAQVIANVGNWEIDLNAGQVWASEQALVIYGLSQSTPMLSVKTIQELVSEKDRSWMDKALRALWDENTPYDVQFAINRADDHAVRIIHSHAVTERDSDGNPLKVIGIIQDITELKNAERALAESNIMLEATLQATADGIEALDLDGNIIFCNDQFKNMWKLPDNMTDINDVFSFVTGTMVNPNKNLTSIHDFLEQLGKEPVREIALKDGRVFERHAKPIITSDKASGYVLSFRDISARKHSEQALLASETKHRAMIANISDSIVIVDQNSAIRYVSPNLEKLFGWSQSDIVNHDFSTFVHPEDIAVLQDDYFNLTRNDGMTSTFEFRLKCKDGIYRFIQLTAVNRMRDPNIQGILMNFYDITERKKRENEILYLNYHDLLTGLYNRAFFEEECSRLDTERQLPISVIMGDINGLKLINDAFGHKDGDRLLVEIAKILSICCRKEDILARTGGDEFCILLPQTTTEEARAICKRVIDDCKKYENKTDNGMLYLSISLGYATKTNPKATIDSILIEAEEYMYKQKLLERKSIRSSLLSSIKTTMNEKSHLTAEHEERLATLSKRIGSALELSDVQINELELLSTLHDIGKLSINDQILNKPGKLAEEEWAEIRKHPDIGYRIAQASPELMPIADYILCHHERWDGKGYPQGLSGGSIPLLSRIVSIVDAYDAMTQDRPYRKAMPEADAINEIKANAGTQFDPKLASLFVEVISCQ